MKCIANTRGLSILEVLFAAGILGFLLFSLLTLSHQLKKQQVRTANLSSIGIFKGNLSSVTLNSVSWQNTLKANSTSGLEVEAQTLRFSGNMDCLKTATTCDPSSSSFALIDSGGHVVYDGTDPNSGINFDGTICKGSSCPMRFNLKWTPICPLTGPCIASQVSVEAEFVPNSQDLGPINPARYSISPPIIRNSQ